MIVVADTSVILNLCRITKAEILLQLFEEVWIPIEVRAEFANLSVTHPRFLGLAMPPWLRFKPIAIPYILQAESDLDAGEKAAIALALEASASAVLIDETIGRQVAKRLGLETIGLLGVLLRAREQQLLPAVKPILDQLEREANFWISDSLRAEILRIAGEGP